MKANLAGANLIDTNLAGANLTNAILSWAALDDELGPYAIILDIENEPASLEGANLENSNLSGVKFYTNITLPDGNQWTPDTDLTRFTDPEHPDFWQPE